MIKYILIIFFSFISLQCLAEYKGLKKLSKNNSFMDNKGNPYSIEKITDKENTLLLIWNHGSYPDTKIDKCKKKPKFGYEWEGAVVPAVLKLHNKKIKNLTIKIYRLCSGVKGMSANEQRKIGKLIKNGQKIDTYSEIKQQKRQNIILQKADEFLSDGFKNIVLVGYSAGGWASLNLISRFPEKFRGAIALNPAFAGPIIEWQKDLPEWGFFRDQQIDIFKQTDSLSAILFAHNNDEFENPNTLSFFKSFKDLKFIDYSQLKPTNCDWADIDKKMSETNGHSIPQSTCFTHFIEKNNYFIKYLDSIFN